jgi:hypothetical protein
MKRYFPASGIRATYAGRSPTVNVTGASVVSQFECPPSTCSVEKPENLFACAAGRALILVNTPDSPSHSVMESVCIHAHGQKMRLAGKVAAITGGARGIWHSRTTAPSP